MVEVKEHEIEELRQFVKAQPEDESGEVEPDGLARAVAHTLTAQLGEWLSGGNVERLARTQAASIINCVPLEFAAKAASILFVLGVEWERGRKFAAFVEDEE